MNTPEAHSTWGDCTPHRGPRVSAQTTGPKPHAVQPLNSGGMKGEQERRRDTGASSCPSLGTCGPQKTLGWCCTQTSYSHLLGSQCKPSPATQVSPCDSQTPTEHQRVLRSREEGDHHFPVTTDLPRRDQTKSCLRC